MGFACVGLNPILVANVTCWVIRSRLRKARVAFLWSLTTADPDGGVTECPRMRRHVHCLIIAEEDEACLLLFPYYAGHNTDIATNRNQFLVLNWLVNRSSRQNKICLKNASSIPDTFREPRTGMRCGLIAQACKPSPISVCGLSAVHYSCTHSPWHEAEWLQKITNLLLERQPQCARMIWFMVCSFQYCSCNTWNTNEKTSFKTSYICYYHAGLTIFFC